VIPTKGGVGGMIHFIDTKIRRAKKRAPAKGTVKGSGVGIRRSPAGRLLNSKLSTAKGQEGTVPRSLSMEGKKRSTRLGDESLSKRGKNYTNTLQLHRNVVQPGF